MAGTRRRLWDISPALGPGIPVWPGDTEYREERTWAIGPDCPVNVGAMTLSTHTGAHVDAPLHYDPGGAPVGALDLSVFVGPCRVVDATGAGVLVAPDLVRPHLRDRPERIVFKTRPAGAPGGWDPGFTAIDPATMDLLAARGCRLVGIDTPSVDPQDSKTLDAHMRVRAHGMTILEGVVLDGIEPGDYELIALPLRLVNLDASPVRAVLRELER
ncbi:MAG TPA: arylformamidase [Arenibaculum sp.]|nr:arylformamidase [Arenibaculum sp.]